jgi:hypothetical protein
MNEAEMLQNISVFVPVKPRMRLIFSENLTEKFVPMNLGMRLKFFRMYHSTCACRTTKEAKILQNVSQYFYFQSQI